MNLITCDWLNENLNQKDLSIIDCTWHLPGTNRDGKSEFLNERIPGSIFFDLDEFSDQSSKYPHTIADKEWFSKKASELGIQNSDHIICYDTLGIFTSPRVSWMFSQYGHEKVSILDGGFKNWKIKKFKIEKGKPQNKGQSNYVAAKAGIEAMSKTLAREVGSKNITVNCVAPGFIETDMLKDLDEDYLKTIADEIPLQRLGKTDEIASLVKFLASEEANYITGQTVHINGGLFM